MISYPIQAYCPPMPCLHKKFSVRDYLDHMENAALEIAEEKEPVDRTIILWWGLDGLRLDEDGTLKWISRKKAKSAQDTFCQTIGPTVFYANNSPYFSIYQQCESLRDQIIRQQIQCDRSQMDALRVQFAQQMQNACCVNHLMPEILP